MTRRSVAVAILVVLGALALVPVATSRSTATTTVNVTALDTLKFKLSKTSAPAGKVVFKVKNGGHISHDFKIAGKKTPMLAGGKSATLTVTLKKGKFPYLCTVPGHAAAGMKGTFTAK
jgi:nitrite reductase (NO-forming)